MGKKVGQNTYFQSYSFSFFLADSGESYGPSNYTERKHKLEIQRMLSTLKCALEPTLSKQPLANGNKAQKMFLESSLRNDYGTCCRSAKASHYVSCSMNSTWRVANWGKGKLL